MFYVAICCCHAQYSLPYIYFGTLSVAVGGRCAIPIGFLRGVGAVLGRAPLEYCERCSRCNAATPRGDDAACGFSHAALRSVTASRLVGVRADHGRAVDGRGWSLPGPLAAGVHSSARLRCAPRP